jgi:hypothetical protein
VSFWRNYRMRNLAYSYHTFDSVGFVPSVLLFSPKITGTNSFSSTYHCTIDLWKQWHA